MKIHIGPYRKNRAKRIHIDDYDIWNMDHTLALIICPMLKKLKETAIGYPSEFADPDISADGTNYGGNGGGVEAWNKVLDQMIAGFELMAGEKWPNRNMAEVEKAQHALYLFAHYYMSLWD